MIGRQSHFVIAAGAALIALHGAAMAQLTKAEIYFEANATDGDVGLHGLFDGDSWSSAKIKGPGGTFDVIRAYANSESSKFGVNELFFESNEPLLEERSFRELTMQFPPGTYQFSAVTTANETITGSDVLTSKLPCPAIVRTPRIRKGELSLNWRLRKGVYNPDDGVCDASTSVKPVLVQTFVVLTFEDETSRVFSAEMSPSARSVEVPDEFLAGADPDTTEAKAEVIVVEEGGNRTTIEVEFDL